MAATVPQPPGRPLFKDFKGDLLNIIIKPSPEHGGSSIIKYELWADQGDDYFSDFTNVTRYAGVNLEYSISPADNLIRGRSYRFKTRALNQIGFSEFSDIGYIAYGDVPAIPIMPTLVTSTETSISVAWQPPALSDLPVLGYVLSMDDGINGEFKPIFIGTYRPDILTFTAGDLETGFPYRFYVQAVNENGISNPSPIATFYSCRNPAELATPL